MSQIILQPSGNKDAEKHYSNTIQSPVPIETIARYVRPDELNEIIDLFGSDGHVPTWGVTSGKKDVNKKKWEKIDRGDVALFSAKKKIFASGVVALKLHNRSLAAELWGVNRFGETWEYIYFLDEVSKRDISYSEFNKVAGYSEDNLIQGFSVLKEQKSTEIIAYFDLQSDIHFPNVPEEEYEEIVRKFDDTSLDASGRTKIRKEQSFLRGKLFGKKKTYTCGICQREYPINMLVAAHIKKRAMCTHEEKLDYKHIVLPMCKFGCDDLYEKGYITIKDGLVKMIENPLKTQYLNEYLDSIVGKRCEYWNRNTQPYFEWHSNFHTG